MGNRRTIGFIGIGNMGWPMAANLVRAGHAVIAYDAVLERARQFAADHAARAASGPEAFADCDIIITMLPTGRDVRSALLEREIAAQLKSGSIVIDMSSADAVGTRALGRELATFGLQLVDAPVSGGVTRAKDGSLTIMIGGDPAAIAAVKPVLAHLGKKLFEVGGPGCGHAMKCLNNFLGATSFAAACEAIRVGQRFGLDPATMIDVINHSTGRTFASENQIPQEVLSGRFASGFFVDLLAKDVQIAADLAAQLGEDAPIGRLTRDLWREASAVLGPGQDHTRAATVWGRGKLRSAAE